jgi:hypothetical protein
MKRMKMLGALVVVAAALSATFGAGAASATVLCKVAAEPCPSTYGLGTEVEMELVAGMTGEWTGWGDSCPKSRVSGKVSNAGSGGSTVTIQLTRWEWIECMRPHVTIKFGSLEIHWVSPTQAQVTFKGFEWQDAFMCNYGGVTATGGTLTESATSTSDARMDISLTAKTLTFGCPEQETWEAIYTIAKPVPLFVSAS